MAEQLPDWRSGFLEAHHLVPAYLESAQKWFDPVAAVVAEHQNEAGRPWLLAVNGSQGSGKSTLCDYLQALFRNQYGKRCIAVSLDDFYLTLAERQHLAQDVHPLLRTRGVPGTHNMSLMQSTLGNLLAGEPTRIPRFDKAEDDRCPESAWDAQAEPVDIVLFEGWCVGAVAQDEAAMREPVNELEADEDPDGRWRGYVNRVLAERFPAVYALVDEWLMLRAPSFDCVYRWRLEQEQKLAARRAGAGVMTPAEVARFIQFYQRLTEHCLAELPAKVNHLFTLDEQRRIRNYLASTEAALQ
ncbi:hypothetical protein E4634_08250 [Mangrovimicrobium sediminis]|uniref:Phosphoribulokinase/uridine kinase domain-containing protein n=1 Tax=Mangrovimicrobium sediminis TaxID=2562682 RepID=A0A4Z0M3T2_9GAMM|nr:hypothetical protein [Haliea sp. SAOS-164]TGD74114.1 hypothetical protein E4634_08250 [Haliea sp. SAOS-164]